MADAQCFEFMDGLLAEQVFLFAIAFTGEYSTAGKSIEIHAAFSVNPIGTDTGRHFPYLAADELLKKHQLRRCHIQPMPKRLKITALTARFAGSIDPGKLTVNPCVNFANFLDYLRVFFHIIFYHEAHEEIEEKNNIKNFMFFTVFMVLFPPRPLCSNCFNFLKRVELAPVNTRAAHCCIVPRIGIA